eukprot:Awhi_evm1s9310
MLELKRTFSSGDCQDVKNNDKNNSNNEETQDKPRRRKLMNTSSDASWNGCHANDHSKVDHISSELHNVKASISEEVDIINISLNCIHEFVSNVTDLNLLHNQKIVVHRQETNLEKHVINPTLKMIQLRSRQKNIKVKTIFHHHHHQQQQSTTSDSDGTNDYLNLREDDDDAAKQFEFLLVDRSHLKQVLLNLLTNSIKFSSDGDVTVDIRLETPTSCDSNTNNTVYNNDMDIDQNSKSNSSKPDTLASSSLTSLTPPSSSSTFPPSNRRNLVISVTDRGPGILESNKKKMFRYDQIKQLKSGTGIGLHISHILVKAMGGSLVLDDSYHSGNDRFPGCRFIMSIPVIQGLSVVCSHGLPSSGTTDVDMPFTSPVMKSNSPSVVNKGQNQDLLGELSTSNFLLLHEEAPGSRDPSNNMISDDDDDGIEVEVEESKTGSVSHSHLVQGHQLSANHHQGVLDSSSYNPISVQDSLRLRSPATSASQHPVIKLKRKSLKRSKSGKVGNSKRRSKKSHHTSSSYLKYLPSSLNVLIVDDDKVIRRLLKKRLSRLADSWQFHEAATGESALTMVLKQNFDLIIMDQYMPLSGGILTGSETVEKIRNSGISDSVIIGSSGNDESEAQLNAGADLFWRKPIPADNYIAKELTKIFNGKCKSNNSNNNNHNNNDDNEYNNNNKNEDFFHFESVCNNSNSSMIERNTLTPPSSTTSLATAFGFDSQQQQQQYNYYDNNLSSISYPVVPPVTITQPQNNSRSLNNLYLDFKPDDSSGSNTTTTTTTESQKRQPLANCFFSDYQLSVSL